MSVNVGYRGIAQVADWLGRCIWSHKNSDSRSATAAKKSTKIGQQCDRLAEDKRITPSLQEVTP